MSCNCKRKIELEEKYGTEEEETIIEKITRILFKIGLFLILFMSLTVIVPIFLIKIFYMIIFTNNRTVWIPNFFKKKKHLGRNNGEEL